MSLKTLALLEKLYLGGDIVSGGAFVGDVFPMVGLETSRQQR